LTGERIARFECVQRISLSYFVHRVGTVGVPDSEEWSSSQLKDWARTLREEARWLPVDQRFEFMKEKLKELPDLARDACEILVFETETYVSHIHAMTDQSTQSSRQREVRFFYAACIFLVLVLLAIFAVPSPTPAQFFVMRLIASCASAAFVAYLPGFIQVQADIKKMGWLENGRVRAAGALAVWIIVWESNPPALLR
jgi:hypothetical protein